MELDNILKLIYHVSKSELSSFSLDEDGTSIKMEAGRISVTASPDNMAVMASDVEIKPAKTEQQHGSNAADTQIQGNVSAYLPHYCRAAVMRQIRRYRVM